MMKRLFFGKVLALAVILLPANLVAQEIIEPVDSIWIDTVAVNYNDVDDVIEIVDTAYVDEDDIIVDSVLTETGEILADTFRLSDGEKWKRNLPQYDLKEYEWVDICYNPRYAVVTKNGKKGLYDLLEHRNITEIIFRDLGFSRQTVAEDNANISLFYATMGIKRGIVSVYEPTNDVVSIWMDDPDEVYSLEECTTIDKKITKRAKRLLEDMIINHGLESTQIVVLDAKTGRLKTWIALAADMETEDAGKLLEHSCAGALTKPFHTIMALENEELTLDSLYNGVSYRTGIRQGNDEMMHQAILRGYRHSIAEKKWKALTDTSNPSTSPFIIAVGYNSLVNDGRMIIPTMRGDSISVQEDVFTPTNITNLREVLSVNKAEMPQLSWLLDNTEWLGYAASENIYAEEDQEKGTPIGKQIQFAGTFPANNPRFTICVVADKLSPDVKTSILAEVVNPLTMQLLKK